MTGYAEAMARSASFQKLARLFLIFWTLETASLESAVHQEAAAD